MNVDAGGYALLVRDIDITRHNVFYFKVLDSKDCKIFIGCKNIQTKNSWLLSLKNGKMIANELIFPYSKIQIKNEDIIKMVVSFGKLHFEINDYSCGTPYEDPRLLESGLYPIVILEDKGD